jgi:hypothetical protein
MNRSRGRRFTLPLTLRASAALGTLLPARPAHAAPPAVILQVAEAVRFAKEAYDLYKQGKDFLDPQPTTAELIAAAAERIEDLIVDTASRNVLTNARNALNIYKDAMRSATPNGLLMEFDRVGGDSLTEMETFLAVGSDPRYAYALGGVYNMLLPLWLSNHIKGRVWGSTLTRAALEADLIARTKKGLQLDYDLVGGKVTGTTPTDTTATSRLRAWVNDTATAQGSITPTPGLRAIYFKTNQTVQEVQRGAAGLHAILQRAGVSPITAFDNTTRKTVTIDVTGWTDNWRGRVDGVWTSVQPRISSTTVISQPCPADHGIVSAWQLKYGMASFLCVPWPNMTSPNVITTAYNITPVRYTCGPGTAPLCNYDTKCSGNDFAQSAMFGAVDCIRRTDHNTNVLPTRGASSRIDKNFPNIAEAGVAFDLPSGTALTGYDPTLYDQGIFGYHYAAYVIPPRLPFRNWETPPPGGGFFNSGPGLAMRNNVSIDLFGRGSDNAVYYTNGFSVDEGRTWTWFSPSSLGGQIVGKPAATSWGPSTRNLAVVGRSPGGEAVVSVCASAVGSCTFTPWTAIPSGVFVDDLAIVVRSNYLYVIGPGLDNRVYYSRNPVGSSYSPSGWTSWQYVSNGVVNSAVAAAVVDDSIYVTARAGDGKYWWTRSTDGVGFQSWASFGGPSFQMGPAISGWTGGRLHVAGIDSSTGQVVMSSTTTAGATWSAFQSIGNFPGSGPAMWSTPSGRTELFVQGFRGVNLNRAIDR